MAKKVKWEKAKWHSLASIIGKNWGIINNDDVDEFVAQIICDASIETGVNPLEIAEANLKFFKEKNNLFAEVICIKEKDQRFEDLQSLFVVPTLA